MIVAVFGPKEHLGELFTDYNRVCDVLEVYEGVTRIVTGGGAGVEQLALRYASSFNIEDETVPPHIRALGVQAAFKKRNEEISKKMDMAVVLWDAKDKYTAELIGVLMATGKPVHLWSVERPKP